MIESGTPQTPDMKTKASRHPRRSKTVILVKQGKAMEHNFLQVEVTQALYVGQAFLRLPWVSAVKAKDHLWGYP